MDKSVEQFEGEIPTPAAVQYELDRNAARRAFLRELMKLARRKVSDAPPTQTRQEVEPCK